MLPSPQQALDAAIVPLSLIKAEHAGLPVPEWYLTNEYFRPPVLCYTVNPFMRRCGPCCSRAAPGEIVKSLTRNFQYAVCCQEIESDTDVREFNVVLGRTAQLEYAGWAKRIWEVFGLPLVRVKLLDFGGRRAFLGARAPAARDAQTRRKETPGGVSSRPSLAAYAR